MNGFRKMLRAKIHRATVTHADLAYEGSITLAPELLEASGILPYEAVDIWDVTNGNRLQTYAIEGERGSETIAINGAAAHLIHPGDIVIIAAFSYLDQAQAVQHHPVVVFVDAHNRVTERREEVPGPKLRLA